MITLFVASFGVGIGFWILSAFVADRLQREHPETYEALGGEKAFGLQGDESTDARRSHRRYLKFLLHRSHSTLNDRYLSALSDFALALFLIMIVLMMAWLITFFANALQ